MGQAVSKGAVSEVPHDGSIVAFYRHLTPLTAHGTAVVVTVRQVLRVLVAVEPEIQRMELLHVLVLFKVRPPQPHPARGEQGEGR